MNDTTSNTPGRTSEPEDAPVEWAGRTFSELSKDEQRRATRAAAAKLQADLNSPAFIEAFNDEF